MFNIYFNDFICDFESTYKSYLHSFRCILNVFTLHSVEKIGTRPLANANISIFGRVKYVLNSPILASNFGFETSPNYSMLIDSSTKDRKALM